MDTCVVGWSSVDSCRAKGLNETICSLMPIFSDVATIRWQCPYKNETKVKPCSNALSPFRRPPTQPMPSEPHPCSITSTTHTK